MVAKRWYLAMASVPFIIQRVNVLIKTLLYFVKFRHPVYFPQVNYYLTQNAGFK